MYPQQPYESPAPGGTQPSGQFDFIMSAGNKQPNPFLSASLKTRVMVVVGGMIVLLLIAWIFTALLSSSTNSTVRLVSLAQDQTEITRVAQAAGSKLQSPAVKNLATNVQLTTLSDNQALLAYLKSMGTTPSKDTLAQRKNANTDQQLAAADTSGTYDAAYLSIAKTQLNAYSLSLQQAYAATANLRERALLSTTYAHVQLLITQSNQAQ